MRNDLRKLIQSVLFTFLFGPFVQLVHPIYSKNKSMFLLYTFRTLAVVFYYLALALLPFHWVLLLSLHLLVCVGLALSFRNAYFPAEYKIPRAKVGFMHGLTVSVLCFFPLLYTTALFQQYWKIVVNSVQVPSSIFATGFVWCLWASPLVLLVSFIIWKKQIHFTTSNIFYFYFGLLSIGLFPILYVYAHHIFLETLKVNAEVPIYFKSEFENRFRDGLDGIYMLGGALFLLPFLVFSSGTKNFLKRVGGVAGHSAWLFISLLFVTGESNYYLTAARIWSFDTSHFAIYETLSKILHRRTPQSAEAPFLLNSLAELEYQIGDRQKAWEMWERSLAKYSDRQYLGEMNSNIKHILSKKDAEVRDSSIQLDVPVIQSADYLSIDWYGVLSAIAYLNPELSDLKLKEKLLKIFSLEEHQLPLIDGIPSLIPTLHRLEVSAAAVFLDGPKVKQALKQGAIPLIYYNYTWIPVVGYDGLRDGYLYYDYSFNNRNKSSKRSEDRELIFGSTSSSDSLKKSRGREKASHRKYTYQKFIPKHRLEQHLVNLGGVGLIMGDTSFVEPREAEAAYLIEQGDIYYQMQNNFYMASKCYKLAMEKVSNWIVLERLAFLKRYYLHRQVTETGLKRTFSQAYPAKWLEQIPITDSTYRKIEARVYRGQAGYILMEQWPYRPRVRDSVQLDSTLMLYSFLHEKEPYNPDYLDSLASLQKERGLYEKSETSYSKLMSLYQSGNYRLAMELAWLNLLQKDYTGISSWLKQTRESTHPAKFLTLSAALELKEGRPKKAKALLTQSLKNDKTLGETHLLMAEYYDLKKDTDRRDLHLKWYDRCRGII